MACSWPNHQVIQKHLPFGKYLIIFSCCKYILCAAVKNLTHSNASQFSGVQSNLLMTNPVQKINLTDVYKFHVHAAVR